MPKMAPTKSNRKAAAKPAPHRKSTRRKDNAAPSSEDPMNKEDEPTIANNDICNSLSSQREESGDAHERNWWAINVKKAATLIERCMKEFGWDRADTKRIFDAYRHFLVLKKEQEDWDESKLIPCWPVDKMWLEHSRMDDYHKDMRDLLGHVVSRRREVEAKEIERMDSVTRGALKERFGSYDAELWDRISISVADPLGGAKAFQINSREPFGFLMDTVADTHSDMHCHSDREQKEFIEKTRYEFDGKAISREDTCIKLGIEDGSTIDMNHTDGVALTIRPSKLLEQKVGYQLGEKTVLVKKESMLSKIFEEADVDFSGERKKYLFLYKQRKIYGFESPIALDMKSRGNVIEVVPRETHHNKNCMCCNPMVVEEHTSENADAPEDTSDDASVGY
ncbi:hypothetical protein ACHAXT_010542 [Thalassiosira profunda]